MLVLQSLLHRGAPFAQLCLLGGVRRGIWVGFGVGFGGGAGDAGTGEDYAHGALSEGVVDAWRRMRGGTCGDDEFGVEGQAWVQKVRGAEGTFKGAQNV